MVPELSRSTLSHRGFDYAQPPEKLSNHPAVK